MESKKLKYGIGFTAKAREDDEDPSKKKKIIESTKIETFFMIMATENLNTILQCYHVKKNFKKYYYLHFNKIRCYHIEFFLFVLIEKMHKFRK